MAYIYQAASWCDSCGVAELKKEGYWLNLDNYSPPDETENGFGDTEDVGD